MPLLREATAPYPKAALFELAAEGYSSVFEILVACIISIRTFDETTLPVARRLFAVARTPAEVFALSVAEINQLITPCTYHDPKAKTIREIARQAVPQRVLFWQSRLGPQGSGAVGVGLDLGCVGCEELQYCLAL